MIVDLCEELAVSLYPAGGFSSITFAYEAADFIRSEIEDGKSAHVIYIGDYDPAGVLIDRSIESELRRHLNGEQADVLNEIFEDLVRGSGCIFDTADLEFHRLAITEEQISAYDLPTKPRKEGDRRALHVKETVEAEAMPAGILRQLLRDKIELFLPPDALVVAKVAEESERAQLTRWADLLEQGGAP